MTNDVRIRIVSGTTTSGDSRGVIYDRSNVIIHSTGVINAFGAEEAKVCSLLFVF
jgi:hypothetical protein